MFTNSLFTVVREWKKSGWPPTNKWIKNAWYLFTLGNTHLHRKMKKKMSGKLNETRKKY